MPRGKRYRNPDMPATAGPSDGERLQYEARDALRTLARAEEIKGDKQLMRAVKREAKEQARTLDKVVGKPRAKRQENY